MIIYIKDIYAWSFSIEIICIKDTNIKATLK